MEIKQLVKFLKRVPEDNRIKVFEELYKDPEVKKIFNLDEGEQQFTHNQMYEINKGITSMVREDHMDAENIFMFANPDFNRDQMNIIRCCLLVNRIDKKIVSIFAKPEFDYRQMYQIGEGFKNGLTKEEVEVFATTEFAYDQMAALREATEKKLNKNQISIIANPDLNYMQMQQLKRGLEQGLDIDDIKKYADPKISHIDLGNIITGLIAQKKYNN